MSFQRGVRSAERSIGEPSGASALAVSDTTGTAYIEFISTDGRRRARRRLIILESRAKLALGIEEKRGSGRDLLAFLEPLRDLHDVSCPASDRYVTRRENAIALSDEDNLFLARVEERVRRNRQAAALDAFQLDVREHPGFEAAARIGELHPDLGCAAVFIDVRVNVDCASRKVLTGIRVQ